MAENGTQRQDQVLARRERQGQGQEAPWVAECTTNETACGVRATIDCRSQIAEKKVVVNVTKFPKSIKKGLLLYTDGTKEKNGLVKKMTPESIRSGKRRVTVGPLKWLDPKKKTKFWLVENAKDRDKSLKWVTKCVTKIQKTKPPKGKPPKGKPPKGKQFPKQIRRILWLPADYKPGSKMRGFHDFNVERTTSGKFKIVGGRNPGGKDVGSAIQANAAALRGCERRGDPKSKVSDPKQLERCMRLWHQILGKNQGNNLNVGADGTSGTYKGGVDGGITIPAGMKVAISGSGVWKNLEIRIDGKKMTVIKDFVFSKAIGGGVSKKKKDKAKAKKKDKAKDKKKGKDKKKDKGKNKDKAKKKDKDKAKDKAKDKKKDKDKAKDKAKDKKKAAKNKKERFTDYEWRAIVEDRLHRGLPITPL